MGKGVLHLLCAAFFFSLMSLFVKLAGERLPSTMLVLARGLVTLVLSLVLVRRAGLSPFGNAKGLLLLRGTFGFLGLFCFFYAVTVLPLAEVTVIHYLNPLLTALLAALVLEDERLSPWLLFALLLGLAGVALVAQPGFLFSRAESLPALGVAAALGGAVASAGAYTTVRKLRHTDHPLVIVLYFSFVAVPASLPFVIPTFVLPRGLEWLWLLLIGLATQVGQVQMTKGLSLVPAGRGTAVGYVQVLLAVFWGALFFDELPGPWALLGAAFILAATLVVAFSQRR